MSGKEIDVREALKARDDFESKIIIKAWEDEQFRKELLANPRQKLGMEFGQEVPSNLDIEVVEETGNKICFVLPRKPTSVTADGVFSDEALNGVTGGVTILYQAPTVEYDEKGTPTRFVAARWVVIP
jgi:hypothetical protein